MHHAVICAAGHTVKNAGTAQTKACIAVTAERRWICTGTPLSNDITDLLGQFAVLQMQPMGAKSFFDARIKTAFLGEYLVGPGLGGRGQAGSVTTLHSSGIGHVGCT